LNKDLSRLPGVQLNFTQPIQNAFDELLSGIKAQLAIKVFGEDMDMLREKAGEIGAAIDDVPGLVDLSVEQSFGQPQVRIVANRQACSRYGVTVGQILEMLELALIGGILGLYLTGEYLSVPASVGFIALFGIAVQNGVVLISYINQLRRRGVELEKAVLIGSMLRLRPVLMTAATTVLGLLPLLLAAGIGSEVQRPLATVVVYGLTSSTLLTLFVLPAVYQWMESNRESEFEV
ncbi:MAG: efflux RND transporter permease subunit, partial [bacterium]|nr:efflux RND transporter permease subunit [bacterium]